jgi:hypothetical protein
MDTPENVLAAIYRAVDWINAELPHRQLNKTRDTRLANSYNPGKYSYFYLFMNKL